MTDPQGLRSRRSPPSPPRRTPIFTAALVLVMIYVVIYVFWINHLQQIREQENEHRDARKKLWERVSSHKRKHKGPVPVFETPSLDMKNVLDVIERPQRSSEADIGGGAPEVEDRSGDQSKTKKALDHDKPEGTSEDSVSPTESGELVPGFKKRKTSSQLKDSKLEQDGDGSGSDVENTSETLKSSVPTTEDPGDSKSQPSSSSTLEKSMTTTESSVEVVHADSGSSMKPPKSLAVPPTVNSEPLSEAEGNSSAGQKTELQEGSSPSSSSSLNTTDQVQEGSSPSSSTSLNTTDQVQKEGSSNLTTTTSSNSTSPDQEEGSSGNSKSSSSTSSSSTSEAQEEISSSDSTTSSPPLNSTGQPEEKGNSILVTSTSASISISSTNETKAAQTIPYEYVVPHCDCKKVLEIDASSVKNASDIKVDDSSISTCSEAASLRGINQKVISYSLTSIKGSEERDLSRLYRGVYVNAQLIRKLYGSEWLTRVYTDLIVHPKHSLCVAACRFTGLDLCNITEIPKAYKGLGELSKLSSYAWRFLPLGDPTVKLFLSRDLEALVRKREVEAVKEWIDAEKAVHVMRDQPTQIFDVPPGLWGARNDLIGQKDAVSLQKNFVSLFPKTEQDPEIHNNTEEAFVATALSDAIYKPMIKKFQILQHDSYSCNRSRIDMRPFPSKRIDANDFVGNGEDDKGRQLEICPVDCRKNRDWHYC